MEDQEAEVHSRQALASCRTLSQGGRRMQRFAGGGRRPWESHRVALNAAHARRLSSGALGQRAVDSAEKAGRSHAHHTRGNRQSLWEVFWISCPAEPSAYAGAGTHTQIILVVQCRREAGLTEIFA